MGIKGYLYLFSNLVFTSMLSFWTIALLVFCFTKILRIRNERALFYFNAIPLVKIAIDPFLFYRFSSWCIAAMENPNLWPENSRTISLYAGVNNSSFPLAFFGFGCFGPNQMTFSPLDWFLLRLSPSVGIAVGFVSALILCIGFYRAARLLISHFSKMRAYKLGKEITVPFSAGIFFPKIYFPSKSAFTSGEIKAIDHHERAHLLFRDSFAKGALFVIAELFWFIPAIHRWKNCAMLYCEKSCDRYALKKGAKPVDLASALAKVARQKNEREILSPTFSSAPTLKMRINALWSERKKRRGEWALLLVALYIFTALMMGRFWIF